MPRILITGSRTWDDVDAVRDALRDAWDSLGNNPDTVLVSGGAKGADALCEYVWRSNGLPVEVHPAKWDECGPECNPNHRRATLRGSYCPTAGFRRNQLMVNLGADLCVAFIKDLSRGASHTVGVAESAGIPVTVVRRSSLNAA